MQFNYGACIIELPSCVTHEDDGWLIYTCRNTRAADFDIPAHLAPALALHALWRQSSFGAVIYAINKKQNYAILTNQYIGATPLYWKDNSFRVSAPEMTQISREALIGYLHYGHVTPPLCMFLSWQRLTPGSAALILKNDTTWEPLYPDFSDLPRSVPSDDEVYAVLQAGLRACGRQGQKRVLAFSGGVDSSILGGLSTDEKPFPLLLSIEAVGGGSEKEKREQAARILNQKDEVAIITQIDALQALDQLSVAFPEPFGHPISIKYWLLCKATRARGGKTLITGDGADDIWSLNTKNFHAGDKFNPIFNYPFLSYPSSHWPKYARILDATDCGTWNVDINLFACGNLMSLHESACANNLQLSLPFVEYEAVLLACRLLADRAQMVKKEKLKRLARRSFPSSIVDAPKRGFRSDAELWFREGPIKERLTYWFDHWPTWLDGTHLRYTQSLLKEHQTLSGKGHSWPLYMTLTLLEWAKHKKITGVSN